MTDEGNDPLMGTHANATSQAFFNLISLDLVVATSSSAESSRGVEVTAFLPFYAEC